jgi:hypothetical protein
MTRSLRFITLALVVLLPLTITLSWPEEAETCGPFFAEPLFVHTLHPELPLDSFANGKLGILKPSYARSYLAVAYRYLSDRPLKPEEAKGAIALWDRRLLGRYAQDSSMIVWDSIAEMVLPEQPEQPQDGEMTRERISEWREIGDWQYYLAITPDAFRNATKRLLELVEQFGLKSEEAKDWVRVQRVVFGNTEGPAIENDDLKSVIGINRQYQRATALFYRANFDAARRQFEAVARNERSPWRAIAPYLAARALTRKGTLAGDTAALIAADSLLSTIKEPSLARAVLYQQDYVRGQLDPAQQALALSKRLQDDDASHFQHELDDYTRLLDRAIPGDYEYYEEEDASVYREQADSRLFEDKMTGWIVSFKGADSIAAATSLQEYKQSRTKPWLVAALANATSIDESLFETTISINDPAYETVTFYRAQLLIRHDQRDRARAMLDEALRSSSGLSSRNDFMRLRQSVATDMRDLLTMISRVPMGYVWADGFTDIPEQIDGKPMGVEFDHYAVQVLNRSLSLDRMIEAVNLQVMQPRAQLELIRTSWVRGVILGRDDVARSMAEKLAVIDTEMSSPMRKYLTANTAGERHRQAIYILLTHPGLSPLAHEGPYREGMQETDSFRDNGWCPILIDRKREEGESYRSVSYRADALPFLTDSDREKAGSEWREIAKASPAVNYLASEAVKWAKELPKDPRVPEVLHLAVKTSRYGCNNEQTGSYSQAAFKVLHSKYSKTKWAKDTPYWFGEY